MENVQITNDEKEDFVISAYNDVLTIPLGEYVDSVINAGDGEAIETSNVVVNPEEGEEQLDAEEAFNVGDYVRCTYDDGIDYEAKIISINHVKNTGRIRYIGYENEQTVKLNTLIATWGEEARNAQMEMAKAENSIGEVEKKPKIKTRKGFNPPPVPPIPPMLFDSDDEEKNQQFAQLLISWFMTGYYTGLHQRSMQESKKHNK